MKLYALTGTRPLLIHWLGWEDLNPRMAESESKRGLEVIVAKVTICNGFFLLVPALLFADRTYVELFFQPGISFFRIPMKDKDIVFHHAELLPNFAELLPDRHVLNCVLPGDPE